MTYTPNVVVVGGGLAGLVAANVAAEKGARVTLLEGGKDLGGRALTQERGGFHFNLGPHALYKAAAGAPVLKELGIVPDGKMADLRGSKAIFEETLFSLPATMTSLAKTKMLSIPDKIETSRVLAGLEKLDTSRFHGVPFSQAIQVISPRPRVQMLFSALARLTTYAHAPDEADGAVVLDQIRTGNSGVMYLDRGWQSLVDKLAMRAEAKGVTIETSTKVENLIPDTDGIVLKDKSGVSRTADAVVLAVSPGQVSRLVGETYGATIRQDELIPVHLASLDLGLSHLPDPSCTFALGIDSPVYFSVHSKTAQIAPPGAALVHVARYIAPDESLDPAAAEHALEAVMDLVQPGWRDTVVHRLFRPNLTVANAMPLARQGGLTARTPVASLNRANIFLAGDWVGSHGLLADASIASGACAGDLAAMVPKHHLQAAE